VLDAVSDGPQAGDGEDQHQDAEYHRDRDPVAQPPLVR
jgi:hypothetical protein